MGRALSSKFRFVDRHVGERLRARRHGLSLTRAQLAAATGLTSDQVERYEDGAGRISASRLWALSSALAIPVSYFFEGLDQDGDVISLSLTEDIAPVSDEELASLLEGLSLACRARITDIAYEIAGGAPIH